MNGEGRFEAGPLAINYANHQVTVNGKPAKALRGNFAEWEIELPIGTADNKITALATDAAGNLESRPHVVLLP